MNQEILLLVTLLSCTLVTNIALANNDDDSRVRTLNCDGPNANVQKQGDKLKRGRDGTISIVGFCNETDTIVSDGVTLSGNKCDDGTIGGGLTEATVTGAQPVEIEYLDPTGPGYAVLVLEGASAIIRSNNIHDNEAHCA